MLLDRRTFAAGSAALLSGCATTGVRTAGSCTPLTPVMVDESRVIRTVAGLRPYRRSGFVVRRDQLGDKALVHNYGHGGGGITLSWGSSKLATELGFPSPDDLLASVGYGKTSVQQVLGKLALATVHEPDSGAEPKTKAPRKVDGAVKIRGVDDLLVRFAKCC